MMENVSPTRMNLLLKREELNSASTGAELLRNKRDVLLREFFATLTLLLAQRKLWDKQIDEASTSLILALGLEGREKLLSSSFIRTEAPSMRVDYKNLLGLKVPEITLASASDENVTDSAGIYSGLLIPETKDKFQKLLNLAIRILPQETKLKRLGQEIKNTTRKVNSLEKFVIPQLCSQIKFIAETLEEREREDVFRLKRLKRHLLNSQTLRYT